MSNPLVSVLIPVYKRHELAIEAIESALKQDYENIEIIVVDNCSPDNTYFVLSDKYFDNSKVRIYQNEENLGPVGNWLSCLEKSSGKYIKILWSDDLMSSNFVASTVNILENNQDVSFVFSSVAIFEDKEEIKDISKLKLAYRGFYKSGIYMGCDFVKKHFEMPYSLPLSPGCAMFRKDNLTILSEIPNQIGYQHWKNGAGSDLLMFLNAINEKTSRVAFIDDAYSYFRSHGESISVVDKSIMDGYFTAKIYYLNNCGENDLKVWMNLNAYILYNEGIKKLLFELQPNSILGKYYTDEHKMRCSYRIRIIWIMRKLLYKIKIKII